VRSGPVLLAAAALVAATFHGAGARVVRPPREPPADPHRGEFWREVIEPHADEIELILNKARLALGQADQAQAGDYDPFGEGRQKMLLDAYGMLRYARRLSPRAPEVLLLLGRVADELGHTREAREVLEAYLQLASSERAGVEASARLGMIALRLGDLDDAVRWLRAAVTPLGHDGGLAGQVLLHLASALTARGEVGAAIDALTSAVPASLAYYNNDSTLVTFALAVALDRDEQRGAAFDVIARMQTALQASYAPQVAGALATVRFAPAADAFYYQAMLDETAGMMTEARAQWALYAAAGDLPYRRRALDHVAGLDALRRAPAPRPARAPGLPSPPPPPPQVTP
jgi:tetratricopeptide (TPR) repeat protein